MIIVLELVGKCNNCPYDGIHKHSAANCASVHVAVSWEITYCNLCFKNKTKHGTWFSFITLLIVIFLSTSYPNQSKRVNILKEQVGDVFVVQSTKITPYKC